MPQEWAKPYAMLEAAHQAQKQGIDVVVGYVEPHARPDTLALLDGLEVLPCKEMDYRGIKLREFDLDGALQRRPQLILVDELAHNNAQGCRHTKRYQDVEELLQAGINVYTTVNVQHLESLNDLVSSITGIVVNERIPDSVFDRASQVELVDIEPEELVKRLPGGQGLPRAPGQAGASELFHARELGRPTGDCHAPHCGPAEPFGRARREREERAGGRTYFDLPVLCAV